MDTNMDTNMDTFTKAYIETILFAGGEELEYGFIEDFAPETMETIINDCRKFKDIAGDMISEKNYIGSSAFSPEEMAGHDFLLTRNGHGAGFWDGGWHPSVANKLTEIAKSFGEVDFYIGDDDKIYC